jgi:putative FmdB family regulatory protein
MPTYVYRCADCGAEIERRQSFSDAPLSTCESCGGSLRRLVFPAGVIFKGSGWYSTDSRATSNGKRDSTDAKEKTATETTGTEKTSTADTGAATPAAESKSTTKESGEKASPKKSEPAPASTKS